MGLFKRLHRITVGRIEAFLRSVEDPEVLFPQLLKEMEDQLRQAAAAEAQASAAVKSAQREIDQLIARNDRMGRGALAAVKGGDEKTARDALTAQIDLERSTGLARENLARVQSAHDRASAARQLMQDQLGELRSRKNEILTRARVAKAQQKIQKSVAGAIGSSDSILDAVARLETSIEESEAQLEIQARLNGEVAINPSLDKRLEDMDRNVEIERRLAVIRQQIGQAAGATT